jgi:hypothetical protein
MRDAFFASCESAVLSVYTASQQQQQANGGVTGLRSALDAARLILACVPAAGKVLRGGAAHHGTVGQPSSSASLRPLQPSSSSSRRDSLRVGSVPHSQQQQQQQQLPASTTSARPSQPFNFSQIQAGGQAGPLVLSTVVSEDDGGSGSGSPGNAAADTAASAQQPPALVKGSSFSSSGTQAPPAFGKGGGSSSNVLAGSAAAGDDDSDDDALVSAGSALSRTASMPVAVPALSRTASGPGIVGRGAGPLQLQLKKRAGGNSPPSLSGLADKCSPQLLQLVADITSAGSKYGARCKAAAAATEAAAKAESEAARESASTAAAAAAASSAALKAAAPQLIKYSCPNCDNSLEVSSWCEGAYHGGGWVCNGCSASAGGRAGSPDDARWLCRQCTND